MPASLTNPGLWLAPGPIVAIVIGLNAMLVSLLRRDPGAGDGGRWGKPFGGARE